jgi:hypothetical protein
MRALRLVTTRACVSHSDANKVALIMHIVNTRFTAFVKARRRLQVRARSACAACAHPERVRSGTRVCGMLATRTTRC